ncbi:hypothetical protein KIN20_020440 [Parelaphostrongylus tenuis]|uniref:Uncharacterized protein n=1 Tax=Parelaphostrongylus tenuis TaxID=148309 RepID=A0AAD5MR98_PARTN|nr:hypothetical protein KIN20_020440 [Parelaphostrongylus tenuis]
MAINTASSMPNLYQIPECDPDYNITLTPDMYTDMCQAMSTNHNMDSSSMGTDRIHQANDSLANSPTADSLAAFYIESSRHTFTVTTNVDNRFPTYQGTLHQNSSAPTMSAHVNSHQQQLCKSNSFPPQYFDCDQYNSSQCMEYEDGYYE